MFIKIPPPPLFLNLKTNAGLFVKRVKYNIKKYKKVYTFKPHTLSIGNKNLL